MILGSRDFVCWQGPILAFIYAVKDLLEIEDAVGIEGLPLNVSFFFEGEEENGSRGAQIALRDNIRWFENTSLTVMCNTQWVGEEVPCLTYGMRGMLSMNVEVNNKIFLRLCNRSLWRFIT